MVDAGTGSGYCYLVNDHNGLYMNVSQASITPGAAVMQWNAGSSTNQQWQLIPAS